MGNAEREAGRLSNRFYNEALNRARIRDLTGAAERLRISLQLNKRNIQARNLYGLVLYERGETVAALREWILSQNMQPAGNLASSYIKNVEKDASRLKQQSRGIGDYNEALRNCLDGNDDVAVLRLRRALQKNAKLIDAELLLALIDIREKRYNQARRLLNRVLKVDRFHPDAVRYLREIAEQTGNPSEMFTPVEDDLPVEALNGSQARKKSGGTRNILRVGNDFSPAVNIIFGIVVGILATCLLVVPGVRSSVVKSTNDRIVELTTTIEAQDSQISELESDGEDKDQQISDASDATDQATNTANSAEHLLLALQAYYQEDYETALSELSEVDSSLLTDDEKTIYDSINSSVADQAFSVYKNLGDTAYYQQDYEQAATYYEKALEASSNDQDTMILLAYCYQYLGEQQKEMETWQQIADAFPDTDEGNYAQSMADSLAEELGVSTSDSGEESSEDTSGTDTTTGTDTSGTDTTTGTDTSGTDTTTGTDTSGTDTTTGTDTSGTTE